MAVECEVEATVAYPLEEAGDAAAPDPDPEGVASPTASGAVTIFEAGTVVIERAARIGCALGRSRDALLLLLNRALGRRERAMARRIGEERSTASRRMQADAAAAMYHCRRCRG